MIVMIFLRIGVVVLSQNDLFALGDQTTDPQVDAVRGRRAREVSSVSQNLKSLYKRKVRFARLWHEIVTTWTHLL